MNTNSLITLLCVGALVAGCASPTQTKKDESSSSVATAPVQAAKERSPATYSAILPDGKVSVYGKVYGDFEHSPVPRFQAAASYPEELYEQKVTGSAAVTFTLTAKGETKDFTVKASQEEFGAAALAAAKKNKYTLAKKDSLPVECRIELLYNFPGPFVKERIDTRPENLKFVVHDK
jgi:TonB family protein